jgi:hypothetical protein
VRSDNGFSIGYPPARAIPAFTLDDIENEASALCAKRKLIPLTKLPNLD